MTGRVFLVGCGALIVGRMCLAAHAPDLLEAHVCLIALALALVAAAPRHAALAAGLLVASAVVSIPMSWDPGLSLLSLPVVVGPAAFFVLAASGAPKNALLWGLGIGGAANAVWALVQKVYIWPQLLANADSLGLDAVAISRLQEARPLGLAVSPDLCGGMCLAGALAAFALAVDVDDKNKRTALLAVAAVSLSGILIVRSFGTALALVVGLGVSAVIFAARRSLRQGLSVAGAGAAVGVLALAVAFATRGADALGHSAGERIANWRTAIAIATEHPVLGVGYMRFPAAYLAMRTPDANLTRYAHSAPLEIVSEAGVVGLVLALAAAAVVVVAVWRRRTNLGLGDILLVGAVAAAGVRLCIDYDGHVGQTAAVTAVLAGLAVRDSAPSPASSLQRAVLAAGMLITLLLVGVLGWREAVVDGNSDDALAGYVERFPFDPGPRLKLGLHSLDKLDVCAAPDGCPDAAKSAHAALDVAADREHPAADALALRARVLIHEGKLNAALHDVDRALAADPSNALAHQLGISIARTLGEKDSDRVEAAARWHVAPPQ